jgi:hypothetical protein
MAALASMAALLLLLSARSAAAGSLGSDPAFTPRVPVSAFGVPRGWLDGSRMHVTSTVSVGTTGWGSRRTDALQVTTLSYAFKAPVWMSLSLGNSLGTNLARGGRPFFLEGFSLAYRPNSAFQFQVQYQDLRSPLQFGLNGPFSSGPWGAPSR